MYAKPDAGLALDPEPLKMACQLIRATVQFRVA
jgi:hypothetical protein